MLIGRRKPLTAAQQFVNLRGNPVSRGEGELRAGRFTWRYSATPSPLGRDYDIRIEFRQAGRPKIFVDGPDLHVLAGTGAFLTSISRSRRGSACICLGRTNGSRGCGSTRRSCRGRRCGSSTSRSGWHPTTGREEEGIPKWTMLDRGEAA